MIILDNMWKGNDAIIKIPQYKEKNSMKKKIASALCLLFTISSLCSCSMLDSLLGKNNSDLVINGIKYESIYKSDVENKNIQPDGVMTYNFDTDISGKNYIRLTLKTDVQLLGEYTYANVQNPNEVAKEEFFIEASDGKKEVEFKQFLDTYRKNAVGKFDKILKSITLTNKSGVAGNVTLTSISETKGISVILVIRPSTNLPMGVHSTSPPNWI